MFLVLRPATPDSGYTYATGISVLVARVRRRPFRAPAYAAAVVVSSNRYDPVRPCCSARWFLSPSFLPIPREDGCFEAHDFLIAGAWPVQPTYRRNSGKERPLYHQPAHGVGQLHSSRFTRRCCSAYLHAVQPLTSGKGCDTRVRNVDKLSTLVLHHHLGAFQAAGNNQHLAQNS